MADEPPKSKSAPGNEPPYHAPMFSFTNVWTGVVGLTKAAVRVQRAEEPVIRKRRSICEACPTATAGSSKRSRCLACTCFIYPKTTTATEKCPLGKW
jgi:hypothetical protein